MMYATLGLQRLLDMIDCGELIRFDRPLLAPADEQRRRVTQLHELAALIRREVVEVDGCLLFPNRGRHEPRLLLRSPTTYTGYRLVTPMEVLWTAERGPIPDGCSLGHSERIPRVSIACSNPEHGHLHMSQIYKDRIQRLAARYVASLGRTA